MKIHFLGHSEFILEIPGAARQPVNLLCDSWLSDFAFGDFMERNPSVRIQKDAFRKLDGIFISHPHCDHLDPYTLMDLYSFSKPDIILPESMLYLTDTLKSLPGSPEIIILENGRSVNWKGITLTGFSFQNSYTGNESDVMPLLLESDNTVLFHEIDSAVPDTADAWKPVYEKFKNKKYKNRIYLATRNELEALFASYDAKTPEIRKKALRRYREKRKMEMEWEYEKFDCGEADFPEIWKLPHLIKIFTGQGMIHPGNLFTGYENISAPYPLKDVLKDERTTAESSGRHLRFAVHEPGMYAEIQNGQITEKGKTPFLESCTVKKTSLEENFRGGLEIPPGPVFNEIRDAEAQKEKIRKILLERFFSYQIMHPDEALKDIIHKKKNKKYVIEIILGTLEKHRSIFYTLGLADFQFKEDPQNQDAVDESYWANDLEDFLEGRQDMFSTTFHRFRENTSIRLWTMLGMPYLNSDLVCNKINFHFRRAKDGGTIEGWMNEVSQKFLK